MREIIINLAVSGPFQNLFSYKIKSSDNENLKPGCRFLAPFGKSLVIGFFVEYQRKPVKHRLRFVKERIDNFPPFPEYQFEFCRWVANYYFAGLGETLAAALPGTPRKKPKLEFAVSNYDYLRAVSPNDKVAFELAKRFLRYGSVKENYLIGKLGVIPAIDEWMARGVIYSRYQSSVPRKKILGYRINSAIPIYEEDRSRPIGRLEPDIIYSREELLSEIGMTVYQVGKFLKNEQLEKVFDESGLTDLSSYPIRYDLPSLELLEGQKQVLDQIRPFIAEQKFEPFLLFGITGSGKTMVYCHAAKDAVDAGGAVMVLVPEIALSGLLLSSFAAFFGDRVAVMHSGLTPAQRHGIRQKIYSGEIRVVIGPRSAIFSPLKNLRLIIVDEEHDSSYKQDDPAPRYHGRDAAVMLARMVACPVILGSASPSVESYHNAMIGRYQLLTLDRRPKSGFRMPKIIILDMKTEKISGECSFLSYRLKQETERHVKVGGQVIYYLNRRGYSPRIKCGDCGEVPSCPDCGVTYTYHRVGQVLKCHFCDGTLAAPERCDSCGSQKFIHIGVGTQRVEENLSRLFTNIAAERIDSDRAATKSGRLILSDFGAEKFNLLLGTQMVSKGLDFPGVTLVGVLSADTGLDMPDFRAAEKAYSKLLQVAGRAGRGDKEGIVIIQTHYSDHPVISQLVAGDFPTFFDSIIGDRKELSYPPFSRMINITLSSEDETVLEKAALTFRIRIEEKLAGIPPIHAPTAIHAPIHGGLEKEDSTTSGLKEADTSLDKSRMSAPFKLTGPAPAPMYKLRGKFRRRLILKCGSVVKVVGRLRQWEAEEANFGLPSKVRPIFDIDPVNMM